LYGRSGGGLLVHQYICTHPDHVISAFTQAAVNRFLDAEFGFNSDSFWDEIGRFEPALPPLLLDAISRAPAERARVVLLLQRQNFFVSSVRVFELFAPVHELRAASAGEKRVDRDLEVGELFGAPLLRLLDRRQIPAPAMDFRAAHGTGAEVYLLAGRFDHTADYRSQIALASQYPRHRILLLADSHDFLDLGKTGLYPRLVQAALGQGIGGPEKAGIERQLRPLIYQEFRAPASAGGP
jgi:pimeloyl-ACP methyl ester carboxylesterase